MMTNPYPGLRAFEYTENHLFFGREGQAQKIANRLEQNHFVAVVGTSGSGKSSLVRAGLLPLLYGGRMFGSSSKWKISVLRPGDMPIHNLATALVHPEEFDNSGLYGGENSRPPKDETQVGIVETVLRRSGVGLVDHVKTADLEEGENLLIVVDQFEELFRFKEKMQVGYSNEAAAFVKLLLEATKDKQNRIYIIITMRSDFLGDCAEFRGLPEAINDGQYLVSRMTRNQLRSSIESPAKVFDAEVSPVLVNHLLNNLEDDGNNSLEFRERMLQDQLPVMQHALMRTWNEWESRNKPDEPISREHYEAIGGMQKALSIHANEAFAELDDKQKMIAEKMFKCLTEKDEENRETRRPTTISEICAVAGADKEEVFAVIEIFRQEGRTFLMPPPGIPLTENTKIDISHESLIRNWGLLKRWSEEEAKNAWQYRRLSEMAKIWVRSERNEDFLWRGRVIEDASKWWRSSAPNQIWSERYQILTDREKNQLAEINRISPNKEPAKRQELLKKRFDEAKSFLDESFKFEYRERDREDQIRQTAIRDFYMKWLKRLAGVAGVIILLLSATIAIVAVKAANARSEADQALFKTELEQELDSIKAANTENEDTLYITNLTTKDLPKIEKRFDKKELGECSSNDNDSKPPCLDVSNDNSDCEISVNNKPLNFTKNVNELLNGQGKINSKCGIIAQWRKKDDKFTALIVLLNISEDQNDPSKRDQYLVVSKLSDTPCVTDVKKVLSTDTKKSYLEAIVSADDTTPKVCYQTPTNVEFEPGNTSRTYTSKATKIFTLTAFKGQNMKVTISNDKSDFYILSPSGESLGNAPLKEFDDKLPETGKYKITVIGKTESNIFFKIGSIKNDKTQNSGEKPSTSNTFRVQNIITSLNIRSAPGTDQDIVGEILPGGKGIKITGEAETVDDLEWVPIKYNDKNGWVAKKFLQPE